MEKRFTKDYEIQHDKSYHVRWASDMASDIKRGWSSFNFGLVVIKGTADEVLAELREKAAEGGSVFLGFASDYWIDESTDIYRSGDDIFIDDYQLREFNPGEWVVVDNVNAAGGLSSHLIDCDEVENFDTIADMLDYIEENNALFDGTGDGECFSPDDSRVVFATEPDKYGMVMYIVEEGTDTPDQIISKI